MLGLIKEASVLDAPTLLGIIMSGESVTKPFLLNRKLLFPVAASVECWTISVFGVADQREEMNNYF